MIEAIDIFLKAVGVFFIIYMIGYSTFLFLSVLVGSSELYKTHRRKCLKNFFPNDYFVPITIVVPAYNEEITVVETVKSLLELDYRSYEIIVVDDGSRDETAKRLLTHFQCTVFHVRFADKLNVSPRNLFMKQVIPVCRLLLYERKTAEKPTH